MSLSVHVVKSGKGKATKMPGFCTKVIIKMQTSFDQIANAVL